MKLSLRYILIICCLPFLVGANTLMDSGNTLYEAGKYRAAADKYEVLVSDGYQSPTLFYNLGNCYLKQDSLGHAILNYEKALLISPNNADIQHNLAIAKKKGGEDFEPIGGIIFFKYWMKLSNLLSSNGWLIIFLLCLWAGIFGVSRWWFGVGEKRQRHSYAGAALILLSLLPLFLSKSRLAVETDSKRAVVLSSITTLRSFPQPSGFELGNLRSGATVELLGKIRNWYEVRTSSGDQGWLPVNDLEKI